MLIQAYRPTTHWLTESQRSKLRDHLYSCTPVQHSVHSLHWLYRRAACQPDTTPGGLSTRTSDHFYHWFLTPTFSHSSYLERWVKNRKYKNIHFIDNNNCHSSSLTLSLSLRLQHPRWWLHHLTDTLYHTIPHHTTIDHSRHILADALQQLNQPSVTANPSNQQCLERKKQSIKHNYPRCVLKLKFCSTLIIKIY